ncbi:MAG: hypothetical protein HYV04_05745 [Deltaproteobacteria bacterium]|nr:hypothetical protein [Deltaproteobacteria bacterium]
MKDNPVFREGVEVYFVEGQGIPVYFYLLVTLAPIAFLTLFLPSLDPQAWTGAANLFRVSAIVALLLLLYFGLRLANREFVPWRFLPLKHWLSEEGVGISEVAGAQLALFCLHTSFFILVAAPLLLWAGAISRTSLGLVLTTLGLLFFYSFAYGVWGLAAAVFWERRVENRQVFVRCLFFALMIVSALVYLPANPIGFLLFHLGRKEMAPFVVGGWRWPAGVIHAAFHLFVFGLGLLAYRLALRRESSQ